MKSKIGIVICGLMGEKQFVSDAYIKAVKSAGGLPIILPLVKVKIEVIADYVKLCSGFPVFVGAGDITPLLFGRRAGTWNRGDGHCVGSVSDSTYEIDS